MKPRSSSTEAASSADEAQESPRSAEQAYDRYAPIYDRWNSSNDYEMWLGQHLLPLLARHDLRVGSVLDVGCGTGRAFEPLLRRNWNVVGCDVSSGMLASAAEKYGGRVQTFKADARDLPDDLVAQYASSPDGFELILMLNDVVNYFTQQDDLHRALAGVHRCLCPVTGLLLFDANTLRLFETDYLLGVEEERGDGWEWRGLSKAAIPGSVFRGRIAGEGVEEHLHVQRHWPSSQVQSALKRAGLTLKGSLGQSEHRGELTLAGQPDEARDDKVIYIASRAQ